MTLTISILAILCTIFISCLENKAIKNKMELEKISNQNTISSLNLDIDKKNSELILIRQELIDRTISYNKKISELEIELIREALKK
jgi:hypothetical protein